MGKWFSIKFMNDIGERRLFMLFQSLAIADIKVAVCCLKIAATACVKSSLTQATNIRYEYVLAFYFFDCKLDQSSL